MGTAARARSVGIRSDAAVARRDRRASEPRARARWKWIRLLPDTSADSFFDVWTEISIGGQRAITERPLPLGTLIDHKPPEDGERYVNPYLQPVELIDPATGQGTGIFIVREVHQPDPTVEHDVFGTRGR